MTRLQMPSRKFDDFPTVTSDNGHVPCVPYSPGNQADSGDGEQAVEDLGADFDPDVLGVFGHGCPACEDDDECCAPYYDEEAIDADDESERGLEERP